MHADILVMHHLVFDSNESPQIVIKNLPDAFCRFGIKVNAARALPIIYCPIIEAQQFPFID
jgi:hypothetical protein